MKPKSAIAKGKLSKYRRWTSEEDAKLISLYQTHTLYQLATIFNRDWNKVGRRAMRLGLKKDRTAFALSVSRGQKRTFEDGRSHVGDANPNWKGGWRLPVPLGLYSTVHGWLHKNYGAASRCEAENCNGISQQFDWALKHGQDYKKDITSYAQLCRSCHAKYDKKYATA